MSDIAYEMLKDRPGLRPAPYLASRGMKWIQHFAKPGLSEQALRDYIRQSHAIVSQGLSKKKRIAHGLALTAETAWRVAGKKKVHAAALTVPIAHSRAVWSMAGKRQEDARRPSYCQRSTE